MKLNKTHHIIKKGMVKHNPQKSYYGVVRVETIDENIDQFIATDVEMDVPNAENFLRKMDKEGKVKGSGYVGDAYYVELVGKANFDKFVQLVKDDMIGQLPVGTHIIVEMNYYPDWAAEIAVQDEEEDF